MSKKNFSVFVFLVAFFHWFSLLSESAGCFESNLMHDLLMVEYVNSYLNYRLPVFYNHFLEGGYINMPSARMGCEGEIGMGYSSVPPYQNYNIRFQFLDRLELSGNYRVFKGIEDPLLSSHGFGDKADKGLNVKFAILHPEDTNYVLPGVAIGTEDFLGTKAFHANYIVATQIFPQWDFEISLGYGSKRIRRWFGGASWMPFRCFCCPYFQDLALVIEYDATRYKSCQYEPHPDGHKTKSPINFGVKYRLWNQLDLSLSYIRGKKLAFSLAAFYNLGMTKGIIPKIDNPFPYTAPINTEPLGPLRPDDVLVQDLLYPLRDQGFELLEVWLSCTCDGCKILRLKIGNGTYRCECDVRNRLNAILVSLIPNDIDQVIISMDGYGFEAHEYHYYMEFVRRYADQQMGPYELHILSPMHEASCYGRGDRFRLFKQMPEWWNINLFPKAHAFFGSAKGKFKYALGAYLGFNGFLWSNWYYSLLFGYNAFSNLEDVKDVDKLNPSQLINVRTDIINYFKRKGFSIEEAYAQRNWNLGKGWYTKFAGGLFEIEYGGIAGEILYYPVNCPLALSIEGAIVRKRKFSGIGFTDVIRKLDGYQPTYVKFHGSQYFANLYYNFSDLDIDLQLKGGKFLANDWGLRTEICRYYPSGLRVFFWYTYTNGRDRINGERYYDKGVGISVPLDIFLTRSSRQFWSYGISAWLRDVGAYAYTGQDLYYLVRKERENCYY